MVPFAFASASPIQMGITRWDRLVRLMMRFFSIRAMARRRPGFSRLGRRLRKEMKNVGKVTATTIFFILAFLLL